MPIVLRLLLLLLAGVSILGARHASRLSNGHSAWPAPPTLRSGQAISFPVIAGAGHDPRTQVHRGL